MDFFQPSKYYKGNPDVGIYSTGHIIFIAAFIVLTLFICIAFRNASRKSIKKYLVCMMIFWWALEIFKIVLSFFITGVNQTLREMLPLYICSLYLYVLPVAIFGKGRLKLIGEYCLTSLCIISGIVTVFYTVALFHYPAWSFYGLHSLMFHGSMAMTGILLLTTGYVRPQFKKFIYGFIPIIPLSIPAVIINNIVNTDYMLMHTGMGTPLELIAKVLPQPIYIVFMFAVYILLTFITVGVTSAPDSFARKDKKVRTDI